MSDPRLTPKRRLTRDQATTLADIIGLLLVCVGIAAIYWPAAFIFAGLAVVMLSWIAAGGSIRR